MNPEITATPQGGRLKWYLLSLAAVAVVGLIHLPFPFYGDHAHFLTAAQMIDRGGALYVDFWDIKPPGVYLYFLAAGNLFGFTEVGIHFFELLCLLGFSVILLKTVGQRMTNPVIASLLPIFTVALYYAASHRKELTQVEAIVALPMFLAVWFAYRSASKRTRWLLFASGLAGGIVVVFKLSFAVVLVPIWLLTVWLRSASFEKSRVKTFGEVTAFVGLGALIPVGLVVLQLREWGALSIAFETFFVIPPRIISEIPSAPIEQLRESFVWLLARYGLMLAIALVGVWAALRRTRDRLALYLATWVLFGLVVFFMNSHSWWPYYLHLITFPIAILAVLTLDNLWRKRVAHPRPISRKVIAAWTVGVLVLLAPAAISLAGRIRTHVQTGFSAGPEERMAFQARYTSDLYPKIAADTEFLRSSTSKQGDIWVVGDPLYYIFSERGPASAFDGWSAEFYLTDQWAALRDELHVSLPSYVFVAHFYDHYVPSNAPEIETLLDESYEVIRVSEVGTWYEVKDAALAAMVGS